jgi:DNA-binding beta-propeller fold protein YncE
VDKAGNIFVCEFGNSRIQVFDANCQPVEIIGGPGAAPGRFANPWGVALDASGNLFVADALNHRVQKLVRKVESRRSRVEGQIPPEVARQAGEVRLLTSAATN